MASDSIRTMELSVVSGLLYGLVLLQNSEGKNVSRPRRRK